MAKSQFWARWTLPIIGGVLTLIGLGLLALNLAGGGGAPTPAAPPVKRLLIISNSTSPYWNSAWRGMQDASSQFDLESAGLRAEIQLCDGTPEDQVKALDRAVKHTDVAALAVSAIDADNAKVAEALQTLKKQGVQIITLDSDVDREKYRDARVAFVGTDNLAAGRALGRCAAGIRPEGGEFVAFAGRANAENSINRLKGFTDGAGEKFKSNTILADDHQESKARENVLKAITDHPDLHTLVGLWAMDGPIIADVVKELNRKKDFSVVIFDADQHAVAQMGDGLIDAMVVQDPYQMGYESVRLMKALAVKDEDTIKKMLPKLGEKEGDIYTIGLKVVVPDKGSPLKVDVLEKGMDLVKQSDLRDWLESRTLP